ncbi:MAG TPA: M23 family metallopeptidase [Actinomycetes bacterium]|nr:M23 family metallopeptidase [Actinomycetes bacterium]
MTPLTMGTAGVLALTAALGSLGALGRDVPTAPTAPVTPHATSPATSPATSTATSTARAVQTSWPLLGAPVLTPFDDPPTYAPGHRGVDLAGSVAQTVVAALAGQVTVAGNVAGRPVVVVQHPSGVRTTYLPVTPLVRVGETVAAGQPIGRLAPSPPHCFTTPCLHWGARDGDRYLDPRRLVGGPIVLLPLESSSVGAD